MNYLETSLKSACFTHDCARIVIFAQLHKSNHTSSLDNSSTPMQEILKGCHQLFHNQDYAIKLLQLLIDLKYDINEPNSKGATPLHYACKYGLHEVVKFLLDSNADATVLDNNGFSAFIKTIKSMFLGLKSRLRYVSILFSILDQGCRLNEVYKNYFHICRLICEGDVETLEQYLQDSPSVEFPDLKYDSLLYIAMQLDENKIVKMLVDKCKVNVNSFKNRPLLHDAIANGNTEIISFLLQRDIDIEAFALIKGKSITPLMTACFYDGKKELLALLEFGADVKKCDKEGFTALHVACAEDSMQCVKILAEIMNDSQIDLNIASASGITPLHLACNYGRAEAIQELAKFYKDLKKEDEFKNNVLHYAAMNESTSKPLQFLLNSNFSLDLELRNNQGETPFNLALKNMLCKNVEVLLNFGAEIKLPSADDIREMVDIDHACRNCPIAEMYLKFRLLGLKIDRRLIKRSKSKLVKYQKELKDLKKTIISSYPTVSLYDMLLMSRKRAIIYATNNVLKSLYYKYEQDFGKKFPHYGFLLNLKYKSGAKRCKLMNKALLMLNRLLGTCIVDTCGKAIFEVFGNVELEKFIEVEKELKSAI